MSDQKNLILAIGLSLVILLGFQFFYELPRQQEMAEREAVRQAKLAEAEQSGAETPADASGAPQAPAAGSIPSPASSGAVVPSASVSPEDVIAEGGRVAIETPLLKGSIALKGGRLDDLVLLNYTETTDPESDKIRLLRPIGAERPYFSEVGWVPTAEDTVVPDRESAWVPDGDVLTVGKPVTMRWDNGQGLVFERIYTIDENYLVTIDQRIVNNGEASVALLPYGRIWRGGTPETTDLYILHEGPLGVFDGTLEEIGYDDLQDDLEDKPIGTEQISRSHSSIGGWIGVTDKYWLTALVPHQDRSWTYRFFYGQPITGEHYQVDYLGQTAVTVAAGGVGNNESRIFAGAKLVDLLDKYEEELGVLNFDLAIDFGWFYFLTKPFFYALSWFNGLLGNFGLAILAVTVVVKLIFFPLANKSYASMAKLRELTPKMQELREQYGDDRQRLNQEMMELYKKEKVNPAAGCLPIFIQIPVFFALYKVLFVSIEMRQAPFYGWIEDLSVPDPTTVFNLFGLIPWDPPTFLMIGIWPIIMGASMYLQQLLNPQPADPVQARVFQFLPLFFTFLLAQFSAGLVIYWAWNNTLSIAQQWVIMRRMGVK